ncbi:MAG: transketolase subunit [Conexibacter sp.]|nr:transketolase subunit [Conexibacter sp.]
MRDAFFEALAELARHDERVWALTGDLGINLFDPIEQAAPGRVLNVGIAEQNLVGVAAGLAYAGRLPFAYSIAPFVTSRPHDQVRVDVAMANAPVTLVGVGGGLAYGYLGPTHHAIEDLGIMRALPNMTVLAPADPAEVRRATRAAFAADGPVYLRLGKNGEPDVLPGDASFVLGRATRLRDGDDVTLVSTGAILGHVVAAADLLAARGVATTVLHYGTLKPFDAEAVVAAAARTGAVVTVEEHSIIGGLGSATAEALADAGAGAPLRRVGVPDAFVTAIGSQEHLLAHLGLDADGIVATTLALLRERRPTRSLT